MTSRDIYCQLSCAQKKDPYCTTMSTYSFWLAGGGTPEKTEELIQQYSRNANNNNGGGGEAACDLARTKNALRDLRRKKR
jgi:hypothetical protein